MIKIKLVHESKPERIEEALVILSEAKVEFKAKNNNQHIIINTHKGELHYWPSTGRQRYPFLLTANKKLGRYLGSVLKELNIPYEKEIIDDK